MKNTQIIIQDGGLFKPRCVYENNPLLLLSYFVSLEKLLFKVIHDQKNDQENI